MSNKHSAWKNPYFVQDFIDRNSLFYFYTMNYTLNLDSYHHMSAKPYLNSVFTATKVPSETYDGKACALKPAEIA